MSTLRYNRKSLTRTLVPASRVVSLPEMKQFLRLEESMTDDDALIVELIKGAEDVLERYTRRAFITQTWKLTLDGFSAEEMALPRLPLQSITSLTTYNTADSASVFSSTLYTLDAAGGRVFLKEGASWPTALRSRGAVEIVYVAGYGNNASDVPEPIRLAVKSLVAILFEGRAVAMSDGCEMPKEISTLLEGYRLRDDLGLY